MLASPDCSIYLRRVIKRVSETSAAVWEPYFVDPITGEEVEFSDGMALIESPVAGKSAEDLMKQYVQQRILYGVFYATMVADGVRPELIVNSAGKINSITTVKGRATELDLSGLDGTQGTEDRVVDMDTYMQDGWEDGKVQPKFMSQRIADVIEMEDKLRKNLVASALDGINPRVAVAGTMNKEQMAEATDDR